MGQEKFEDTEKGHQKQ